VHLATIALGDDGQRDQLLGEVASASYYEVVGLRAALGRTLGVADDTLGADPVAMLSDRYWRRRFGGDSGVLGRSVSINNRPYTIVGIASKRAIGSFVGAPIDVWLPLEPSLELLGPGASTDRTRRVLHVLGRLQHDVTAAQAQSDLEIIAPEVARARREQNLHLEIGPGTLVHGGRRAMAAWFLGIVMALGGLVLLLSAANVANLLLARAFARRRELAVRMALGAGRGRVVRQIAVESVALAALGGVAGLLAARWLTATFESVVLLPGFELRLDLAIDRRVFGFTAAATLAAGLAAALGPALSAAREDLLPALKDGAGVGGSRRASRLRGALVIAQVAVSTVLLVAAGLLGKSARTAAAANLGFQTSRTFATDVDLQALGYTEARGREFYRQLVARTTAIPGVAAVSLANRAPLDSSTPTTRVALDAVDSGRAMGAPSAESATALEATYHVIGPRYFDTVRMPIVAGRAFTNDDREEGVAVAIVNESLARRLWPGEGPAKTVGRTFRLLAGTGTERRDVAGPVEVVGVARDAKYRTVGEDPQPHLYLPFEQHYGPSFSLLVRAASDALPVAAVQAEMGRLDAAVQGFFTRTLVEHTRVSLLPVRLAASVAAVVGCIALGLGAVGLYGVIACVVGERTRELGVRMALGASRGEIARDVVRRAGRFAAVGCGAGLVLAALGSRGIASLLYDVSPTDPEVYGAVSLALIAVTLLAAWIPARRAAAIDPLVALRAE
jgi:predicted permease